jgi:hypothetical protein
MDLKKITEALGPQEGSLLQQLLSNPVNGLTLYSDVELTEDEICQALISAKGDKQRRLTLEANQKRARDKYQELVRPFTAETLVGYCHSFYRDRFNKDFSVDDNNSPLFWKLAHYFTGNQDFNVGDYNLNKGIMIMGNVGVGKTELMRFFQKNKKSCFKVVSCSQVADDYLVYKEDIEAVYSSPIEKPLNDPDVFYQKYIGYCFDDLGTEEVKNNFGNRKNVMADVLMAIYNRKDFARFHITTNLKDAEEIEKVYGSRVRSRLREMFNVFELPGKDRRK